MSETENREKQNRPTWIRIAAITVAVLLLLMIIATMICAFAGADRNIIIGLLMCDILIPVFIWVFLKITGNLSDKKKRGSK